MTTASGASGAGADDLDLFETEATRQPVEKVTAIPAKYAGKSVEDLINMHQNAEAELGRKGNELGQLRRLSDEILNLRKPTTQVTEERKPVTVDALLNDPEKAIAQAVANSDVGRRAEAAETRVTLLENSITERDFVSKHPEFNKDIGDPDFMAWVNKNPLRQALAQRTASKDFVAAQNLWDLYDEHKELVGEKQNDTQQASGKKVPSTVKQAPSDGSKGKQVWSHVKLMELRAKVQQGDPAALTRWNDAGFQNRMHTAYAEQRVK